MNTIHFTRTAWLCALFMAACSSVDEPSPGGRVEHPAQPAPSAVQSAAALPLPEAFTPLDQVIAEECGPGDPRWARESRVWSQDVPDRDCTKDSECGDGFCDRGHCAVIWTCQKRHGQHCIDGRTFRGSHQSAAQSYCPGVCLEGRCRSCASDEECVKEARPDLPPKAQTECRESSRFANLRVCHRWVTGGPLPPTIDRPVPPLK